MAMTPRFNRVTMSRMVCYKLIDSEVEIGVQLNLFGILRIQEPSETL